MKKNPDLSISMTSLALCHRLQLWYIAEKAYMFFPMELQMRMKKKQRDT